MDLDFPDLPLLNSQRDIERIKAHLLIIDHAANFKPNLLPRRLHDPLPGLLVDSFAGFVDYLLLDVPKRDPLLPHLLLVRFSVNLKGMRFN